MGAGSEHSSSVGGSGNSSPRLNIHSIPPSPIVEMPPSPAPCHMPVVEFPSEDDAYEYDELVEVCSSSSHVSCSFSSSVGLTNHNLLMIS
jgi:hypothetical protein